MTIVLVCVAATCVAVPFYLWRSRDTSVGYGYPLGIGLVWVGVLVADLARFVAEPPLRWLAIVGVALSCVAWGLVARTVHRSWRQMLCDSYLMMGAPFITAVALIGATRGLPSTAEASVDVVCAGLVLTTAILAARLAFIVPVASLLVAILIAAFGLLRTVAWGLATLTSAGITDVPVGLPFGLVVAACVAIVAALALQGSRGIGPRMHEADHDDGQVVLAIAGVGVAGVALALLIDPSSLSPATVVLVALSVTALIVRLTVTVNDLNASRRRAQSREHYFRTLVQDASDVIMISSDAGRIEYISPAAERVLGAEAREAEYVWDVLGAPAEEVKVALSRAGEARPVRVQGDRNDRAIEASIVNRGGQLVVSARDVTERDQLRKRLHRMAYQDPLTGLANRTRMLEYVNGLIREDTAGPPITLLFVDLDRFKQINDASGHSVGDAVLRQVAARMRSLVGDGFLARLGGDEFVVVVRLNARCAQSLADAITRALREPFLVNDRSYRIGASAGIAFATREATAEELMRRADLAMYRAKRQREAWALFDDSMAEEASARVGSEGEAAAALSRRDMSIHLQPLVSTGSLAVVGCEALLRWRGPTGDVRSPSALLQFAEHHGQLGELTDWVVERAARTLAAHPHPDSRIAVNVPPSVLVDPGLLGRILTSLDSHAVETHRLELEITEEAMVASGPHSLDAMRKLRNSGLRLVIDDFGTGYSSLSYITRFPVDAVKIDRSFTAELGSSTAARSVVRGLVGVTRELGMRLIAEGVETAEQHQWLSDLDVPLAQGYWFARPEAADALSDICDLDAWSSSERVAA